jgi:hypothetical protein
MTVLRKLLESGFYVDTRYKLIMRRDDGGWRDQHKIEKNLDLGHKLNTADSETEICKGYGADGCRTGNKYGGGLWDEGENQLN